MSDELVESVNAAYAGGEFQHAGDAARMIPTRSSEDRVLRHAAHGAREARLAAEAGSARISVFPLGQDRRGTIARFAQLAFERV